MESKKFFEDVIALHIKAFKEDAVPSTAVLYMLKDSKVIVSPIITASTSPADYVKEIVDNLVPQAYMFCAESWVKKMDVKDIKKFVGGKIKDDPNKEECLVCVGRTIDGKLKYDKMYDIRREKGIELVEKEMPKNGFESKKMP